MMKLNRKLALTVLLALAVTMPLQGFTAAQQDEVYPPRVVSHLPYGGQELPLDGGIDVFFDQPMDAESVAEAFSLEPPVEGEIVWFDEATMRFTPDAPFERAAQYRVVIDDTAAAATGAALVEPYHFIVQTVGYLEVSQVIPADGAAELEVDSVITVVFNRPVVPLVIVEEMDDLPDPITIDPPIEGQGEWLNTSIYVFTPDEPLAGGTTYTVIVEAGLEDAMGGVIQEPFTWSFSTISPLILNSSPDGSKVPLDASVSVGFNQPMDRESVEDAFSLLEAEALRPVAGEFDWADDGESFAYIPEDNLVLETTYQVTVTAGARAEGGPATLDTGYQWEFTTVPYPRIIDTSPENGETNTTPYGGFSVFFNTRMDEDTLQDKIHVEPEPEDVNYYYSNYDDRWSVSFYMTPDTAYTATIDPGMADIYGNTIDQGMVVSWHTGDLNPEALLNTPGRIGVYSAHEEDTRVFATYRNISQLDFDLYSTSLTDVMRLTGPNNWELWNEYAPGSEAEVRRWTVPLDDAARNIRSYELVNLNSEEGGALVPGFYYMEMSSPETLARDYGISRYLLVVATANLTVKIASDSVFVWVTDLETGEPVPQAEVVLYDVNYREIARGDTNSDGVFEADIPSLENLYEMLYAVVDTDDVLGFATSDWGSGIDPWAFGVNANFYPITETTYIYTDRAVYRPGQPVYFKAIVRDQNDVTYTVPTAERVPVRIENPRGEVVYRDELELTEFGTVSDEFTLDDEATLGYYTIVVEYRGNRRSLGFGVAEYRLPEFTVSVLPDRPEVVQGDTIEVTVDTQFYFGGPVSDAAVSWAVLAENYSFNYTGKGHWDFVDYNYDAGPGGYRTGYGEQIASGEGVTDERGQFVFEVPADLQDNTQSLRYTIDVTVTDISDQAVSNRDRVVVHQGEVYVGVRPAKYISTAEQEATVNVLTVDWDSEPVPGQTVEMTAVERHWSSVQEEDEYGVTTWTWQVEEIEIATGEVKTDEEGLASFAFTPETGGVYKVYAVTRDALGNEVRSSTFMWVSGREYVSWRQQNSNRIDLIADAEDYEVGDEAEILIASPFQGIATALITVERAGVIEYDVVTMNTNSYVYKLPIKPEHAPNIYVSAVIVKGTDENNPVAAFRMGEIQLNVSTEQKALNVELEPSTDKAQPGDTVTYEVTVTDYAGEPVQAEVGLALTDQAALDIASANSGALIDHFYGRQGLSVRTAVLLTLSVDQITQTTLDTIKGGGGGGGGGFAFEVREDFIDTPYWNATVVTDEDGKASVDVTLPDNLTTWNMDARAVTEDTLVGQSMVDIVSTKPVLIRPVTPRFLVVGDEMVLGAVVNNNSDEDLEIEVSLAEAIGLEVRDDITQTLSLEAGQRGRVNWLAEVQDVSFVQLIFAAEGGGYQDASRPTLGQGDNQTIPVYKYETPETVGTGGMIREPGAVTETVVLPRTMEVERGELTIQLDPSLAAATVDGLDYLRNYQYQCTEQTVSRFLPNVMTFRALDELGLTDPDLERELRQQVNWAAQRLYAQQHVDGGWGWWINDASNPTVTSYALLGLVEARDAGFEVDAEVINRAADYLRGSLQAISISTSTWRLNRQAFLLYVLARAGRGDIARTVLLYDLREKMNYDARAFLALALSELEQDNQDRIETLLADFNNAAILSATGAHWEEASRDWWNWSTDTRTTALVLSVLARLDNENPIAAQTVRWLMVARTASRWETTQETAWAIMALTDWMKATGELEADYTFRAILNSEELVEGVANADTIRETTKLQVQVAELLKDEANRLTIIREEGPGVLYYTTHLRVFLPVEEVEPLNRGIILDRRYSLASDPDETPITEARVGDIVNVTLTIIAPHDLYYVVVEDPIPAGTETINTSLLTTSAVGQRPRLSRTDPLRRGWGWWWFSYTQLRDEKVVLSATRLPAGTYEYHYQVRVGLEGTFRVMPPTGYEFYFPEVYGRGAGSLFTVLPEAE